MTDPMPRAEEPMPLTPEEERDLRAWLDGRALKSVRGMDPSWVAALLSTLDQARRERDALLHKEAMAWPSDLCPNCCGAWSLPPHREIDGSDEKCPNPGSVALGETGDYSFVCGCPEVCCPDCPEGRRIRDERKNLDALMSRALSAEESLEEARVLLGEARELVALMHWPQHRPPKEVDILSRIDKALSGKEQ